MFSISRFQNSRFTTRISQKERYSLFFLNILTYAVYGILGASFGVSFETLQSLFGYSTHQMSAGLALQAVGGCISSILATFTLDKYNRQMQFFFVTLSLGLIVLMFPFSPTFSIFLVINLAIGFFCTFIDCITNAWVVELFRPQEHVFIQILHFFYSFGSTISPFLLGPFLNKKKPVVPKNQTNSELFETFDDDLTSLSTFNYETLNNSTSKITLPSSFLWITNQIEKSNVWIPLVILAISIIFVSLLHFLAYFIKPYREFDKKKSKKNLNVSNQDLNNNLNYTNTEKSSSNLIPIKEGSYNKAKNLSKGYYVFFVVMIVMICTFEVANEVNAINFLPKVLVKSKNLNLDEERAGYVFAILQSMITGARFVNIFLSFKVNTVVNIYINFIFMLSGSTILMMFIQSNLFFVKIGVALLGLGYSSTFPLIISFVEQRISLTNRISSIMAFSSVFGLCVSPFIIGYFVDANPISFVYITILITFIAVFFFSSLYIMEILRLRKR